MSWCVSVCLTESCKNYLNGSAKIWHTDNLKSGSNFCLFFSCSSISPPVHIQIVSHVLLKCQPF